MTWGKPVVIVERRSNPTHTDYAKGSLVKDSNGTWWTVVDAFVTRGTADRRAIIDQNGVVHEQ